MERDGGGSREDAQQVQGRTEGAAGAPERARRYEEGHRRAVAMGGQVFTVYDMIARGASLHGEAPAVIQDETSLSFQEFKRRGGELAGGEGQAAARARWSVCRVA